MHSLESYPSPERKLISVTGYSLAIAVPLIVLIDGFLGKPLLANFPLRLPDAIMALSFIATGAAIAVCFHISRRWNFIVLPVFIGLLLVMMSAALYLGSDGNRITFDLPDLNSPEMASAQGGVLLQAFLNFILVAIAITLFRLGKRGQRISSYFAGAALASTFGAALINLFRFAALRFEHAGGISEISVLLFFCVCIALLSANPEFKLGRLLVSDSSGGVLARRLLPLVVIVPTVVGFVRVLGQEQGLFGTSFGTMIANFSTVLLMFTIVSFLGRTLDRSDKEMKAAVQETRNNEERYRHLFEYSQSILSTHDLDGKITSINSSLMTSLDYPTEEVIGKRYRDFMPERYASGYDEYLREIVNEGEAQGLASMISRSGQTVVWQYHNILVTEEGREPYILGSALDVSHLLRAQNELQKMSLTDELTGLRNRRGFLTIAEQMLKLEGHSSTARGLTLLFADMDGLKAINDTYGHEEGSEALQALARVLKRTVRNGDVVARWGGDEFAILTIGADDGEAEGMVERIQNRIEDHNLLSGKAYKLSCSIGVAPVAFDQSRTVEEALAEADKAMYDEKKRRKRGRNIVLDQSDDLMPDSLAWY